MPQGRRNRDKLGIMVATDRFFDQVEGLARAAHASGRKVDMFLTGRGVFLVKRRDFVELAKVADVFVCDFSFRNLGLPDSLPSIDGVRFVNQAVNIRMMRECKRFVVF